MIRLNVFVRVNETNREKAIEAAKELTACSLKEEGCIAVEMEVSACQAVASFRGYQLYTFLYRADNLDSSKWEKGILSQISIDERLKHFFIALEIAKRVINQ